MKKATTFFIAIVLSYAAYGQQDSFTQAIYWIRYQNQLIFSPSVYWTNEVDNRRFFDPDVASQLIFHSRLHYKRGPWDLAAGLTYSLAFAQQPELGYDRGTSEIRPVIEASYEHHAGKILLINRIRIDNRFLQSDPDQNVFQESNHVLRMRYRFQAVIPLKKVDHKTSIGLRLADEIMFNNHKNTFDQNRVYATGEFVLNKNFSLEAGYIYIYQQRFGRDEFYHRHVLRFSVMHRIKMRG
ncbi:MAG TPA: DUF2490 domain-containing protein [Ohtaekwangia sp.]|nr:DUF2490 domain-containing protein [Ohtaekwangia sp.]